MHNNCFKKVESRQLCTLEECNKAKKKKAKMLNTIYRGYYIAISKAV